MIKGSISKDIYNYISQNWSFFNKTMNVLLFVVACLLLYFNKDIFNDPNVSFYAFSSVVQGFLALVGFLGAVTIFKIQLIENDAQKVSTGLEGFVKDYNGIIVHTYSWSDMINACEIILNNENNTLGRVGIKNGYDKLCNLRDQKSPIRNSMVDFSLLSMVNIMIALLGIPLAKLFITKELFILNALLVLIVMILSFICIRGAFKVIRFSVGYSFSINL
jgi:hypothetical protein